ncbi:MAG: acyl-CoA dehydrogenase family protein, partial [Candidatus Binatia bacterium]
MIDFSLSQEIESTRTMIHTVAETTMRPLSREYDEREHEKPMEWLNMMWNASKGLVSLGSEKKEPRGERKPSERQVRTAIIIEELSWGDAGLYLSIPNSGLGGAAVMAAGTPEQKERFLARFRDGEPKWGAMAITESGCGSDSAAITTTARRDGDHWVLNGTKIFCTSGRMAVEKSEGFVVVWATVDKSAGRAGIKAFIVDHHTSGMTVAKVENKMGIRASDTAMLVFEDCRIPLENILGSPEVQQSTEGFKGVMATFDATRPIVAASAIGIGRAAVDFVREALQKEGVTIRYHISPTKLTTIERDFMDMEANLQAARLLTWRASWMMDQGM